LKSGLSNPAIQSSNTLAIRTQNKSNQVDAFSNSKSDSKYY